MPGEANPHPDGPAPHFPAPGSEAIVRLKERDIGADEASAVARAARIERIEETRRTNDLLGRIAGSLGLLADRLRPATVAAPPHRRTAAPPHRRTAGGDEAPHDRPRMLIKRGGGSRWAWPWVGGRWTRCRERRTRAAEHRVEA
ncbi:hypothetical protein ME763_18125 [Streptomyces murinus]|uniref:hypothetical protein n=1 Tax=Streptomyces murinus TaxID=33900 RepID=UPI002379A42C|nr:hypothetical protein [Streptomyces murinus]WDO07428.1 hypothetical protein ME763_18125 [Streptomyces murinus]